METSTFAPESSPFEIPHDQLHRLRDLDEFQLLRTSIADQIRFCEHHSQADHQTQQVWLLHRDILYALAKPIVKLYDRATTLAQAALCTTKQDDLELAFPGDARGAFLCLQCFICEERDWCEARGCAACVLTETLSTDSHIRFVIAAALLSDIPALSQILPALRSAIDKDSLWAGYWETFYDRATQFGSGIKALLAACEDLESLVSSSTMNKPGTKRSVTVPTMLYLSPVATEGKGAKLKQSKLAARQLRMKTEEMEILRHCALHHWAKTGVAGKMRHELLGRAERRRCATGP